MEPLLGMVVSAVGTVASGALSGAGGELGRRSSEQLFDLLRRSPRGGGADGDGPGGEGPDDPGGPTLPVTESQRSAAVLRLMELVHSSPQAARDVSEWVREAAWLAPRSVPAVAHGASRPRMLPPATAVFTDREDVLAWLTGLLDEDAGQRQGGRPRGAPVLAVLTGPGGIGKTAAAVHCALELEDRFPDGVLFADLNGASAGTALPPSDVLARFLERLGVPPASVPGDEARQRDLYLDCTAGRRMIVVLDNAHDDAQVLPLLPASPECLVLVTGRRRPARLVAQYGARPFAVGPLSSEDSVRLLRRVVGDGRPAAPEQAVRAVADGTGGNPLALCTTGAGLAVREHLSWQRVARRLSDRIHGHDREGDAMRDAHPDDPGTPADPVRAAQDVAYGELTPACAALYRAIAVAAWPTVTVACAAWAADVEDHEARALLEELARSNLLEEVGEERYRFHDLTRAHARELALAEDGHARVSAAVRRVAVGQLRFAAAADFRVMPQRWRLGPAYRGLVLPADRDPDDGRRALAELRRERENLAAVIRAAAHHGFDDLVWQLCEAMWTLHLRLGFHAQWTDTHVLGVEAAGRSAAEFGDRRAVGRMWTQLAFGHMGAGRAADAEAALGRAVAAERDCGHHRGEASAVEARGLLRLRQWEFTEAERCFGEAREILDRIGPDDDGWRDVPRATALLTHHIGRALAKQRRVTEAAAALHDALARFRRLDGGGDRYNEGRVYMSLGDLHLDAGEADRARVCLDEAVKVMTEAGAGLQLADALVARARCHRAAGRAAQEAEDLSGAAECLAAAPEGHDGVALARVRARLAEIEV
ncbi:tetratricopeptide repeat protein [Streptomyces sp. NRRL F-5650]|uniref:tetratricopeptide repeat protein n=1 Tax=Streptomyces sp. NRRL F-5650 TaxID=1463868 RepID=UPI000AA07D28|nr:tetratricopeptide repeat protein [Streptomyces sp. NRRL F-5650]